MLELRQKTLPTLNSDEQKRVEFIIERLVRKPKTRRMFTAGLDQPKSADLHKITRSIIKRDGDFPHLPLKGRQQKPVDVHVAVDVSGSMKAYAPTLMMFAFLLQRNYPGRVTTYSIGTKCTPLREGFHEGRSGALRVDFNAIPDYQGGTNLADSLKSLAGYAYRRSSSRRQLLLFSDGWDAGDPTHLKLAMTRLSELFRTIIWANPHAAVPGFQPVQQGMVTVLPHIQHLVSGHSLAALEHILTLLTDSTAHWK